MWELKSADVEVAISLEMKVIVTVTFLQCSLQ